MLELIYCILGQYLFKHLPVGLMLLETTKHPQIHRAYSNVPNDIGSLRFSTKFGPSLLSHVSKRLRELGRIQGKRPLSAEKI